MSAEVEEVVVDGDEVDAEDFGCPLYTFDLATHPIRVIPGVVRNLKKNKERKTTNGRMRQRGKK
ncbi:hypothetical protein PV387_02445, partial [Streptomyces sp. ME02-6987-2C]|uniref:hypothetical protein n=1 Tax=Streptomyces sp. ME02-6987-2C TaxID=3028676 RepID=UPI0029A8FFE9